MAIPTKTAITSRWFVEWLYDLAERGDRARLAALRRGLTLEPTQMYELYRVIPPQFLAEISWGETERRLMLAALFATHPLTFPREEGHPRRRNLGESLRLLAERRSPGPTAGEEELLPEPLKRRMDALLAAHADDLFGHLQQVIRLLKSAEVPVDWEQLLSDLRHWEREDRRVQWNWSRSFYVGFQEEKGGQTYVS